jgi:small basic protein
VVVSLPDDLKEFDHEVEILNVVFGAALGAYIGIVMSSQKLSTTDTWLMVFILIGIANFLLNVRAISRAIFNQPYFGCRFPWNVTQAAVSILFIEVAVQWVPVPANQFIIIFRGWAITLALFLAVSFARSKWQHD